ncbi:hypothetical protein LCGC14_1730570 [marine sediment metagenome]|uniref:Uncharacterized protein n=1 Tax=marine sediment metagenome TaxID=412755 RepID=A0A0F9H9S0_9ZZZZ
MFSFRQKQEIADKVQEALRSTDHPELPKGEIKFILHVCGAESWSFADIKNNGLYEKEIPTINPHNEAQDNMRMK